MLTRIDITMRRGEGASALIGAIAVLVLAAFVAGGIIVSAMSSNDGARRQQRSAQTEQIARDAGTVLAGVYSAMESGEHDLYVPRPQALFGHRDRVEGGLVLMATHQSLPDWAPDVNQAIPNDRRFVFRQDLGQGIRGFWQLYATRTPVWGQTKNGVVHVYIRVWTDGGSEASTTTPAIYRLIVRPTWFADYQMLFDGRAWFGGTAKITGRVHSNGIDGSFFNQYEAYPGWQIRLGVSGDQAECTNTARITTSRGSIEGSPSCTRKENTKQHVNLLRVRDAVTQIRNVVGCGSHAGVVVHCDMTGTLNLSTVPANDNKGHVYIWNGDAKIRGQLKPKARAMVIATYPPGGASAGNGSAPSVHVVGTGPVGAAIENSSTFGIIAEGDVILDEVAMGGGGCKVHLRGASIAVGGLLSSNASWRVPFPVAGGKLCSKAIIEGSIVGHYPPVLYKQPGMYKPAGFNERRYLMLDNLYDNPPPLFPTTADWQVIKFGPANLDCLNANKAVLAKCAT